MYFKLYYYFIQDVIAQFRTEVESYEQTAYLDDFHQVVQDDMLMIGSLSKHEFTLQEQKMKEEELMLQQKQVLEHFIFVSICNN